MYMPANGIQELLLHNGITIENNCITFYDEYPQKQHIPTERLVIKDLPAFIPHSCVADFLKKFRQLTSTTNISFSRDRVNRDTPSEYINGESHLYVHSPVTPPCQRTRTLRGGRFDYGTTRKTIIVVDVPNMDTKQMKLIDVLRTRLMHQQLHLEQTHTHSQTIICAK